MDNNSPKEPLHHFVVDSGLKNIIGQELITNDFVAIYELVKNSLDAHATKEAFCQTTGQSMLEFKDVEYKRRDIDNICKTIVNHENNIQSILDGMQ